MQAGTSIRASESDDQSEKGKENKHCETHCKGTRAWMLYLGHKQRGSNQTLINNQQKNLLIEN
jgi:hypothetical protein